MQDYEAGPWDWLRALGESTCDFDLSHKHWTDPGGVGSYPTYLSYRRRIAESAKIRRDERRGLRSQSTQDRNPNSNEWPTKTNEDLLWACGSRSAICWVTNVSGQRNSENERWTKHETYFAKQQLPSPHVKKAARLKRRCITLLWEEIFTTDVSPR